MSLVLNRLVQLLTSMKFTSWYFVFFSNLMIQVDLIGSPPSLPQEDLIEGNKSGTVVADSISSKECLHWFEFFFSIHLIYSATKWSRSCLGWSTRLVVAEIQFHVKFVPKWFSKDYLNNISLKPMKRFFNFFTFFLIVFRWCAFVGKEWKRGH